MTTIGEWTIKVRTQSPSGGRFTGQNMEVLKLLEALGWNLPITETYRILGTSEDGSYEVVQKDKRRKG
jgi:hypothetical protein